jgi:hypothetical protein
LGFFIALTPSKYGGFTNAEKKRALQGILWLTPHAHDNKHPLTPRPAGLKKVGDRPQGVAGDCNSLAETHAWFDSKVAHHFLKKSFKTNAWVYYAAKIVIYKFQWVTVRVYRSFAY